MLYETLPGTNCLDYERLFYIGTFAEKFEKRWDRSPNVKVNIDPKPFGTAVNPTDGYLHEVGSCCITRIYVMHGPTVRLSAGHHHRVQSGRCELDIGTHVYHRHVKKVINKHLQFRGEMSSSFQILDKHRKRHAIKYLWACTKLIVR